MVRAVWKTLMVPMEEVKMSKKYFMCHWVLLTTEQALATGEAHFFKDLTSMKKWLRKQRRKYRPHLWSLYKRDFGLWKEFRFIFLRDKKGWKWLKQRYK